MLSDDLLRGANAAAEYSGLSARFVYHLVERNEIPFVKRGRTLFFRKSELDQAFAAKSA